MPSQSGYNRFRQRERDRDAAEYRRLSEVVVARARIQDPGSSLPRKRISD